MRSPQEIDAELRAIQQAVDEKLSANVHAKTTAMLERLLPDNAGPGLVGAVAAGMLAGVFQELWERSGEADLAKRTALLREMVDVLVQEYCAQFALLTRPPEGTA